jgi:hypothetical protein
MHIPRFRARLVALALVIAALGAACSSSNDEPAAVEATDAPAATGNAVAAEPAADGHQHDQGATREVTYTPIPTVTLDVAADPVSGWNVHAVPTGHRLAPEHASTDPIEGEGHMHLYVDGVKVARLYGEWFHLPALEPGDHEIRVELSANDHSALAVDSVIIDATTMVTETAGELVPMENMDDMQDTGDPGDTTAQELDITVADGTVTGGGRIDVALGTEVTVRVVSDSADEVHVHGYDLLAELTPGVPAEITFVAELPGVWEVELENAGLPLAEMAIS